MLVPVILSGGAGTRLWPISREAHPKPFMHLDDGQSLLQKTLRRVASLAEVPEVLTVTNRDYYFKTKDEFASVSLTMPLFYMLEPMSRNTAPAISMAAWYVMEKYGPTAVLLIQPADHLIEEHDFFHSAAAKAHELAKNEKLVTFGITPTAAETGFGYIKVKKGSDAFSVYPVEQFIEKPNAEKAQKYLESGDYFWNSGMFCFQAKTILNCFEQLAPEIFEATYTCWEKSKQNHQDDAIEIDHDAFANAKDLSIDYAVMEKAKGVVVVPCDFQWNDIGSWSAVSDLITPDESGNRTVGETLLIDVNDSFIHSKHRLVAAIGVDDLVIVDTPDALLVTKKNQTQQVKQIVNQLKEDNHDCYKMHRTVFRPWGSYTILEEAERFKMKRIIVKPGASLSLQMHHHRSEHWVVVSGVAKVTNGENKFVLNTNESTFIPAGNKHRIENPGLVNLVLIEVQTGEYLGEDDIIRFEDCYGREVEIS